LGIDDLATDDVVADLAALGVQLHEVLLAIELLIRPDEEATSRERLRAILAHEVVGVVVLAKRLDDLSHNGRVASGAVRPDRNILSHYLWLLLCSEHVRIIAAAWARRRDRAGGSRLFNESRHVVPYRALKLVIRAWSIHGTIALR